MVQVATIRKLGGLVGEQRPDPASATMVPGFFAHAAERASFMLPEDHAHRLNNCYLAQGGMYQSTGTEDGMSEFYSVYERGRAHPAFRDTNPGTPYLPAAGDRLLLMTLPDGARIRHMEWRRSEAATTNLMKDGVTKIAECYNVEDNWGDFPAFDAFMAPVDSVTWDRTANAGAGGWVQDLSRCLQVTTAAEQDAPKFITAGMGTMLAAAMRKCQGDWMMWIEAPDGLTPEAMLQVEFWITC